MPISFSIVRELPPSRWGASHLPNKIPKNWTAIKNSLRSLWISGAETSLETAFVCRLDLPDPRRLPD